MCTSSINNVGLEATREKWQAHWSNALTEADLNYLTTVAHCTTIRLPIGYFTLGPDFTQHTPFAMSPSQVYTDAWSAVVNMVRRCYAHGVGVLLDFHACPGGANAESHSGISTHKAELWGTDFNISLTKQCLCFIAAEVKNRGLEGVVGLQLCNEAISNAPGMYSWYDSVISSIVQIDSTIPIYISDAWDLPRAVEYSVRKNTTAISAVKSPINPVIVDTHRYYAYSVEDARKFPLQIIDQISSTELSELDTPKSGHVFEQRGAVGVFVGEWSCALAPTTWAQVTPSQRKDFTKELGKVQAERWRSHGPAAGGGAFWTYNTNWRSGKECKGREEWNFRMQVDTGAIRAPSWLSLTRGEVSRKVKEAEKLRSRSMVKAMEEHEAYWDVTSGKSAYFEHWRYGDGWHLGWCDARDFFAGRANGLVATAEKAVVVGCRFGGKTKKDDAVVVGADRIGFLDLWVLKRMRDEGPDGVGDRDREGCEFGWEWEQGFRKGVRDFERAVGVGEK